MTEIAADLLIDSKCILAEGIQWNGELNRLFWTDIHGAALWSCDADGGQAEKIELPERLGSFAFDRNNRLLCAFASGLFRWDRAKGQPERLTEFEPDQPTTRYNDGRCDRQGRFIVGGMNEQGLQPTSSLTRFADGAIETLATGIGCSNSICFSPNGRRMYFTDTPKGTIWCYEYDPKSGEIGGRQAFATISVADGFPDGSCVDGDGAVWNTRFNGHRVCRILPDGTLDRSVYLPVPQVTCACFGGPNLERLYITTARENMSPEEVAKVPLSGGIFVADPGCAGLPETRYAGDLGK